MKIRFIFVLKPNTQAYKLCSSAKIHISFSSILDIKDQHSLSL